MTINNIVQNREVKKIDENIGEVIWNTSTSGHFSLFCIENTSIDDI